MPCFPPLLQVIASLNSYQEAAQVLAALQDSSSLAQAIGSGEALTLSTQLLLYTYASVALTQDQPASTK